jgi:hypothetical protein
MEGDVAFDKSSRSVTLADAEVVQVDLLSLAVPTI